MEIGSSHTPSRPVSPATVKHIVPGEASVPHCRSQSGPSARMWGSSTGGPPEGAVPPSPASGRTPYDTAIRRKGSITSSAKKRTCSSYSWRDSTQNVMHAR